METIKNKTYSIEKSPLYQLKSRKKLLEMFYVPKYNLLEKLTLDQSNYKIYNIQDKNKPKKRKIEEPKDHLKKFHKRFNDLLQRIEVPEFVKAGIKGSCYVDNGRAHINGKYFFCSDIEKFFPNSRKQKVFQFLLYDLQMEADIASLLTSILTYDNHLPTGAPSSQLLTYWAYKKTFNDIYKKAKSYGILMTLFVDDLTFSSEQPIPQSFKDYVVNRLNSEGLSINKKKTKTFNENQYKKTTGTVISPDNKLLVPNKLQHKIYILKHKENKTDKEIMSLKGMLNSARQINKNFMNDYYTKLMQTKN